MKTKITHNENVHVRKYKSSEETAEVMLLLVSDAHWDNPKCDRGRLTEDLQEAKQKGAKILLNGDTFCLMQGKYDPRKSKSSIRPEHNHNNYLDRIVDTAVDYFLPYAECIDFVGYGNHETNILSRLETDPLANFVKGLNLAAKTNIGLGGYGGWYVSTVELASGHTRSHKLKYYHGSGGGAPVTLGTIQHNRMQVYTDGADCIWMGHVHNDYTATYTVQYLTKQHRHELRDVLMVRTATYKEEYKKGASGWHVERGAPPKPLGGRWLKLTFSRSGVKSQCWRT